MFRRPVLQIVNASGKDVLPGLSGLWKSCHVREQAGGESDTAEIVCVGPPSRFGLPARGAQFTILGGWADEGPVMQGAFTVQKIVCAGDPESGDAISIQLRAADYVDKLKAHGFRHYDDKTFGDIIQDVAKFAGLDAQIDPSLASIAIPYRLWRAQSAIDFATELAEEHGASVKPAGGKLIAVKRGAAASASGRALAPILIQRRGGWGYEIEVEPRPEIGHVAAGWHDESAGKRKVVKHATGRDGPIHMLPHPFRTEDEAKGAAESMAYEMLAASGSGRFESPGLPHAHAEAKVIASGFGFPIDGLWKAEAVDKVWDAGGGFSTSVEVSAGDEQKGAQ